MSVTLTPDPISRGPCITVSGASGGRTEVIVEGSGMGHRFIVDIKNGQGFACLRFSSGIPDGVAVTAVDGAGNEAIAIMSIF